MSTTRVITAALAAAAAATSVAVASAQTVYIGPTHPLGAPSTVSEHEIDVVVGAPAVAVQYPRELAPLVGTVPLDRSVAIGVQHAVPVIHDGDTVLSVSQGSLVAELARRQLAQQGVTDVTWVSYGDPVNTDGGLLTKIGPIPTFPRGVTEQPCGCQRTTYALEYDIIADAPDRPNPLSWANAVMGGIYEHNTYTAALVNQAVADGATVTTQYAGGTHVLIKAANLPLTRPLRQLGVPDPVVDRIDKVLRPMVDAGYDRGPAPRSVGKPAPRPHHTAKRAGVGRSGR